VEGVGRRLLLVDDYPDALEAWTLVMRLAGYDVTAVATGEQALDAADRVHPDVILLDLQLPGVSGFEVARRLRTRDDTADIPLIAVTGLTPPADGHDVGWEPFVSIVCKPCNPANLLAEVERVLAASGDTDITDAGSRR
jgi:CheY-like chemotaxis protein